MASGEAGAIQISLRPAGGTSRPRLTAAGGGTWTLRMVMHRQRRVPSCRIPRPWTRRGAPGAILGRVTPILGL